MPIRVSSVVVDCIGDTVKYGDVDRPHDRSDDLCGELTWRCGQSGQISPLPVNGLSGSVVSGADQVI
jgi:hypothetical protein